ncbi:MAG TPA: FliH/SctL family protein [Planctomycetota bacterium]|nr:FliH/SctL family protein [Planctomycetota bacterium]
MRRSSVIEVSPNSVAGAAFVQLATDADREKKAREAEQAARKAREAAEWTAKVSKALAQGEAQGEKKAAERVQSLVAALEQAHGMLCARLVAEAETQTVELAQRLASMAMRTQVQWDESVLKAALNEALQRTAIENVLRLRVNPDDLTAASILCGQLSATHVQLTGDPGVGRGGCIIDTNLGEIDSTIERRWQAALKLLAEKPAEDKNA